VLELSPKSINPGDQGLEPALMDLLLEPSDLSAQPAKMFGELFRTRLSRGIGRRTSFQGTVRAVHQLADLPAQLGGVRSGAVLVPAFRQIVYSNARHRMVTRRGANLSARGEQRPPPSSSCLPALRVRRTTLPEVGRAAPSPIQFLLTGTHAPRKPYERIETPR
jgi:hypothetical protein